MTKAAGVLHNYWDVAKISAVPDRGLDSDFHCDADDSKSIDTAIAQRNVQRRAFKSRHGDLVEDGFARQGIQLRNLFLGVPDINSLLYPRETSSESGETPPPWRVLYCVPRLNCSHKPPRRARDPVGDTDIPLARATGAYFMKNIFIGNLDFSTGEDELRQLFAQYGKVARVALMTDRDTGRSRGFAFVEMTSTEEGERAIIALNGTQLGGRTSM